MRTNWFIVIYSNGKWWVDNEGHSFGPFKTREIAALEAVEYAKKLGDPQRASLIYWAGRRWQDDAHPRVLEAKK